MRYKPLPIGVDDFRKLIESADEALEQIEERHYEKELLDDNYSVISRYGIAFCGKECMVRLAAQ